MANQEHLSILKQGVGVWNEWRQKHSDSKPDLSGADLSGADLWSVDLHEARLTGADLTHTNLNRAYLSDAYLSGANLGRADLREARLTSADLSGADLNRTDLRTADLSGADLRTANLTQTNLSGANLTSTDLRGSLLVDTDLSGATLTQCSIYGISVWKVQLKGAKQDNLIITSKDEPTITVDNLEVAQFIYLLLNYKSLRDILDAVTERGVLLLGRFGGGGLNVLQAIAARLREANYLPIIFDFERPQDRNYTETVKTLAGLSRFVIVDLSGPSVPQEFYATVPHFKIPFIPIIEASRKPYSMAVDILEYPWVISPPITFATIEELLEQLPTKVIAPAEEKHKARQKLLDELFKDP